MVRKIIAVLVLVPLAIIIVMFAVANRESVTVTFDPFSSADPAFLIRMPLYMLVFVLVGLGVLIGGIASWLRQHKWRSRARHAEAEVARLRQQLEHERARPAVTPGTSQPVIAPPSS